MNLIEADKVTAVILAGGQGRRMGGVDKGLMDYAGETMVAHLLKALMPQVGKIIINANRNLAAYREFGYPLVTDELADFQGPLAGLLAAMQLADTDFIMTVPCDGPLLPPDLTQRLLATLNAGAEIAVAHDGARYQPVYALLPRRLQADLRRFLAAGDRKILLWYRQHALQAADFSDIPETFINLNTPDDRLRLLQPNPDSKQN